MEPKSLKLNQSVEKALQIIEVLSSGAGPMRLVDIAAAVKMPQSTALRLLQTLVTYGYANQDADTLKYTLSLKFVQIGNQIRAQNDLIRIVRPYLRRIADLTRESVCLSIEEAGEVVYMDVIDGPDGMLQIRQRLGKRAPLYCTGSGKIFLTNRSEQAVLNYYNAVENVKFTPMTVSSARELWLAVRDATEHGFALDNEECELGARCVAVGIRDYNGRYIAAISVSGPVSRLTHESIKQLVPELLSVSGEVSTLFAYKGKR